MGLLNKKDPATDTCTPVDLYNVPAFWFRDPPKDPKLLEPLDNSRIAVFMMKTALSLNVLAAVVPHAFQEEVLAELKAGNKRLTEVAGFVDRGATRDVQMVGTRFALNKETSFGP